MLSETLLLRKRTALSYASRFAFKQVHLTRAAHRSVPIKLRISVWDRQSQGSQRVAGDHTKNILRDSVAVVLRRM